MNIVIIGAGAAGCFAAIEVRRRCPSATVTVLERGRRALAKVSVTGGGRCNLTNSFADVRSLEQVYPRGHRLMKRLFHRFSHDDVMRWFEESGVSLVTQADGCVFPRSQDAMQIVTTLLSMMRREGVRLLTGMAVSAVRPVAEGYEVVTSSGVFRADRVVVATGGHPSLSGFDMLAGLELDVVPPVPSLFSLCIADRGLTELMGTVVERAQVSLVGTKLRGSGPLLVTHWGISGPATLRLSSVAARVLAERGYAGVDVSVNWLYGMGTDGITCLLSDMARQHSHKKFSSVYPEVLNSRLWCHLLTRASLSPDARWGELQGKGMNRLHNVLVNDTYRVSGKNKFKDEFVTCGGVSLASLRPDTLEAKCHRGLFFAGEVTDVDAVTGGFNLQAAWTMGYVVACGIAAVETVSG